MINKVILLGRLGQTPELKKLKSGTAIVKFSVCTWRKWFNEETATLMEEKEWHNLTAFKNKAENICKYCKKGDVLYFEGRLKTSNYEKDGQKHYRTEIIVNDFKMTKGKGDSQESSEDQDQEQPEEKPKAQKKQQKKQKQQEELPPDDSYSPDESDVPPNDDIPF